MASVKKRTTASGEVRYDVRWRVDGRPVEKAFRKAADAEAYKRQVEGDEMRGIVTDPRNGRMTVAELAADWLAAGPGKREGTVVRDEIAVRLHISPAIGKKRIVQVTPTDVQAMVTAWSAERAPRSVIRDYAVLRAMFAMAVDRDLLGRTPCRGIRLPQAQPKAVRIVTVEELEVLANAMGSHGLMAHVAAQLGLRWGEVAGMRVGRIDILGASIAVAEQVTRGRGGRTIVGPPKSLAGRRVLSVGEWLVEALTDHVRAAGTLTDLEAFVFPGPNGGPLDYSNWHRNVWKPAIARTGLTGLGFHDLRRACATYLVADGVDMKTTQQRMGHSDPRLTLAVYAQATTAGDRRAADLLSERLRPSSSRASTDG